MDEQKVYSMEDFKKENKKREVKAWVQDKCGKAKDFYLRNKDIIIVAVPAGFAALTTFIKVVGKNANLRKEEDNKNLYCYDRSLGHYWKLRRELTNSEWVEIDKRKRNGERLADILDDFKVLK